MVPRSDKSSISQKLSKGTLVFLKEKKEEKKKTRRGGTRIVRIWEQLNRDIDEFIILWEFRARSGCVSRSRGVEGSIIGCKARQARARSGGLSYPPITLGWYSIGILIPRVKQGLRGFVFERDDKHPDHRAECLLSPVWQSVIVEGSQ